MQVGCEIAPTACIPVWNNNGFYEIDLLSKVQEGGTFIFREINCLFPRV